MTTPQIVLLVIFVVFLSLCGVVIARTRGRNQTGLSEAEKQRVLKTEEQVARTQEPERSEE